MMTSSNENIFRATSPLCGEFTDLRWIPFTKPVTRSFDVFFDLRLNEGLSKQSWGWWFEAQSRSLWRHCNGIKRHRSLKPYHATKNETRIKFAEQERQTSYPERPVPCTYGTQTSLWLHVVATGTRLPADTFKTKISRINFPTQQPVTFMYGTPV